MRLGGARQRAIKTWSSVEFGDDLIVLTVPGATSGMHKHPWRCPPYKVRPDPYNLWYQPNTVTVADFQDIG